MIVEASCNKHPVPKIHLNLKFWRKSKICAHRVHFLAAVQLLRSCEASIWDRDHMQLQRRKSVRFIKQCSIIKALVSLCPNAHGAEFLQGDVSMCRLYKQWPEPQTKGWSWDRDEWMLLLWQSFWEIFPNSSDGFAWAHYIPFFVFCHCILFLFSVSKLSIC